MVSPRLSAVAKVARAEETARHLLREITTWLQSHPAPFLVTGQLRGTDYVFRATGTLEVPVGFAILVGEIFYQLRTALDHLLAALIIANGGTPNDKHQFPIASTAERFAEAMKRGDIRGVSSRAQQLIERFQPYQPPATPPTIMGILRDFTNTDKHRALVVVGGGVAIADKIAIEEVDGPVTVTGMSPPFVKRIADKGTDFFTLNLGEPHSRFRASIACKPQVVVEGVAPLECATVEEVITNSIRFLKNVFAAFEPELTEPKAKPNGSL